jgi:hypothetical protein
MRDNAYRNIPNITYSHLYLCLLRRLKDFRSMTMTDHPSIGSRMQHPSGVHHYRTGVSRRLQWFVELKGGDRGRRAPLRIDQPRRWVKDESSVVTQ